MTALDTASLLFYVAGIFVVGGIFGAKIKNTADLFAAGKQSPWWVAGLSGFMTMFSAGTFVVWGGIAFKHGIVAVSINMCYGIAALLAGYFVAGRWRKIGVTTPAEYIRLRFGKKALHFYTWTTIAYRMTSIGVALYSVAIMLTALLPLPAGNIFRDAATGNLALHWAVLLFGTIVVVYTVVGGLWAVLMTDVLQFIVLTLAVMFVVPMLLTQAGGFGKFLSAAPDGFFSPTTAEFTWIFLTGWVAIHFFAVGAEWAFVQRFLSVPSSGAARKSAYLFGVLYLVSPWLWLLPPMLYRLVDPTANPEQAYILAAQHVLPAGMVGLMLAAMFSATASMIDSQLNVLAGVLTRDFYRGIFRPDCSEARLVRVGRIVTILLGAMLVSFALVVPWLGGAQRVVLSVASLVTGPILLPALWALFSKKIGQEWIWPVAGISFFIGAMVKFGLAAGGWFTDVAALQELSSWVQSNSRVAELFAGVATPAIVLLALELFTKRTDPGWQRLATSLAAPALRAEHEHAHLPALVVAWTLGLLGMFVAVLALVDLELMLGLFAGVLVAIAGSIAWQIRRTGATPGVPR